jgi:hypothetical protein
VQVNKLPGWPPQGGAGAFDSRAATFVSSPETVTVRRVDRIVGTRVDITCMFGPEVVTFRYHAPDLGVAESMAKLLEEHRGKDLLWIGMLQIPKD